MMKRIFSGKEYFVKGSIWMGTIKANLGLGQLSGLM